MVLLRVVVAVGGLTFVATGIGILFSDTCQSVTWGSRGRAHAGNFTATCNDAVVSGGMSQGIAGLIAVTAGLILLALVVLPSISPRLRQNSQG